MLNVSLCRSFAEAVKLLDAVEALVSGKRYARVAKIAGQPDLDSNGFEVTRVLVLCEEAFIAGKVSGGNVVDIYLAPFLKLGIYMNANDDKPQSSHTADSLRCLKAARVMFSTWFNGIQNVLYAEAITPQRGPPVLPAAKRAELVQAMFDAHVAEVSFNLPLF